MNAPRWIRRGSPLRALGAAIVLSSGMTVAAAQQMDHSKMQMPATAPAKSERAAKNTHAKEPDTAEMPASEQLDHAAMGHDPSASGPETESMDHAAMGHETPKSTTAPREPIPVLTDADRAAAFPEVVGHGAHDKSVHSYWLIDRLELAKSDEGTGVAWEELGWVGTDLDRLWLRSEGESAGGSIESADVEVLYGRNVSRWWDLVAGVRHDFGEDPSQTFAGIGVIGLSPYKFEVEATAYVGQSGQTAARIEVEYDTLLTNRLILQWQAEADFYGRDDDRRGIGSGLSTFDAGLRLRYEISRQFAPFIGVAWERAFGGTADLRRAENGDITDTRIVAGVRIWF